MKHGPMSCATVQGNLAARCCSVWTGRITIHRDGSPNGGMNDERMLLSMNPSLFLHRYNADSVGSICTEPQDRGKPRAKEENVART